MNELKGSDMLYRYCAHFSFRVFVNGPRLVEESFLISLAVIVFHATQLVV